MKCDECGKNFPYIKVAYFDSCSIHEFDQGYKKPSVTVDAIMIKEGEILLIRRGKEPFAGLWALPGGFIDYGESAEVAVLREVKEETNMDGIAKQFRVYSTPDRDPRGHTISIVFAVNNTYGVEKAGDDASDVNYFPLNDLPPLAFDHRQIINDYKETRNR